MPKTDSGFEEKLITLKFLRFLPLPTRILIIATVVLLSGFFAFYPAYPTSSGKSLLSWMWRACNAENGFLHGRLALLLFPLLTWIAWRRKGNEDISPSYRGLVSLSLGFLINAASIQINQPRLAVIGLPFVILGFTQYFFGTKIAKGMVFPAFFLWFAIPVPGLETYLNAQLGFLKGDTACFIGKMMGIDIVRTGHTIALANSELTMAEGSDPLKLVFFTFFASTLYANYTQKIVWKKWFLFASSVPFLIFANACSALLILTLAYFGKEDLAMKTYHDWASVLIIWPISMIGLILFGHFLKWREKPAGQ
jgi:exosortase